MPQNKLHTKIGWQQPRWLMALIGLILLVVGQVQITRSVLPSNPPTQFGQWLNDTLHFDIPSIDNVLNGLPILLIGSILLAVALRDLRLMPSEKEQEKKPFAFHLATFSWSGILCAFAFFGTTLWSLATREYTPWMAVGWLISLLIIIVVIAIWDQHRGVNLSPGLTRQDILWMLGLAIIGLVIGAYRLQGVPDSLMGDEGNFWTTARDIATGIFKPPIFSNGVYSFPILSSYLQAWALKDFGINLWGWRFSSVLSGVATILPFYLLARETFNRKVAIASSIALILSPYYLAFARLGYNNIQALFITTLTVYWLYIGLNRDSHLYLFLAGCVSGLGFYTYFSARVAFIISLAFIGLMLLDRKIKFRQAAFAMTLLVFGTILIVGPYFIYGISHEASGMGYKTLESLFFNTFNGELFYSDKELFAIAPPLTINGNTLFYNPKIYLVLIVRGLARTLLAFQKPGFISEHFISSSLTGTVGAFFYLIGLGITLLKFKQPRSLLLLLWFFSAVFGLSSLNTVPPRHTHMVSIIPALALLTGIGLYTIASTLSAVHAKLEKYKNSFLAIVITGISLGGLIDYFVIMPGQYHPQPDQVMSWAVLYAQDESFLYIYSDPGDKEFRPFIETEFRQSVPFGTISVDIFNQAALGLNGDKKTIIFYAPDLAEKVEPVMQTQWGDQYIQKNFYNTEGIPVLAAGMNTPFVFVRDQSLPTILKDSYIRPSFLIFIVILIGLLAFTAIIPIAWTRPVPEQLRRLTDWFKGPDHPDELEEEQVAFLEEDMEIPSEELHSEPPEWAEQIFQPDLVKKPERLRAEFKRVTWEDGKDYYIKIHIPPITILGFRLPEKVEFALPAFHIPNPVLITLAVLLAIVAQIMVHSSNFLAGIVLYLLSAAGLIVWYRINPKWTNVFGNQWRISPRAEIWIGLLLLAAVIFTRFYDLGYRVYGLEADETKWTAQSWFSTILQVDRGEFATAHYRFLPVDFWVRSIFLRIFGLNFISARIESAFISMVSAIFLYLLIRKLVASPPTALLGTLLLSFSFIELNTSHQALHDTPLGIWIMGGLFFLVAGLKDQKLWQFQLSGIFLALGLLTYDTFFPTAIFALAVLLGTAIYQVFIKHASPKKWFQNIIITLWPILLAYLFFTQEYMAGRQLYYFSLLRKSISGDIELGTPILFLWTNLKDLLATIFSSVVWQNSLLRWNGTMINPILVPFIVIGMAHNLSNLRRPYYFFLPVWFLSQVIPPIVMGTVWPRVIFTCAPVLIIWGALGLWVFLAAMRTLLENMKIKLAIPAFVLLIVTIVSYDYYIFTSGINDPLDCQKRRELADLTMQSASSVPIVLYPYMRNQDDSVYVESHVILFSVAGARHTGLEAENNYGTILFEDLLPSLWQYRNLDGLDIIYDKTASNLLSERQAALEVILRCYPSAGLATSGRFLDVYHLNGQTLQQPKCYQDVPPVPIAPQDGAVLQSGTPITFSWDTNGVESTSHIITLERKSTGIYWIEAEDAFVGPGWEYISTYVNDFSGKGFLQDGWQAGDAQYTFTVPEDGQYRIWVRSYKRRVNDQHNFIKIDGKKMEFARDSNTLDAWVWEDLGTYNLSQGQLPMTLSRTYGNDEEYSVFVDVLLITSDLVNSPDQVKVWESAVNTGEVPSTASEYTLPEILPPGDYRWKVRIYDGTFLIESSGARGLETPTTTFTITP